MASPTDAGLDETFDALMHPYRRYVLYYLRTHTEEVTIDTLSAILTEELDGPSATAGEATHERIGVALQHTHLPKLADAGLITIAQDQQSIALDGVHEHGEFIDQAARVDGYAPPTAGD